MQHKRKWLSDWLKQVETRVLSEWTHQGEWGKDACWQPPNHVTEWVQGSVPSPSRSFAEECRQRLFAARTDLLEPLLEIILCFFSYSLEWQFIVECSAGGYAFEHPTLHLDSKFHVFPSLWNAPGASIGGRAELFPLDQLLSARPGILDDLCSSQPRDVHVTPLIGAEPMVAAFEPALAGIWSWSGESLREFPILLCSLGHSGPFLQISRYLQHRQNRVTFVWQQPDKEKVYHLGMCVLGPERLDIRAIFFFFPSWTDLRSRFGL